MAGKYDRVEVVGSGAFGRAWLVRRRDTDKKYVLKEMRVSGMTDKDKKQSLVEVEALAKCKHVNVVRYKEAFVDKGFLCIIMEYGDMGDMKKRISELKGSNLPGKTILDWFVQICFALKYIHGLKILHRDLKTQNIFLTSDNIVKIGDFGIARILQDSMDQASTAVGTPFYLSPEICQRLLYNNKSDMWAAGCVLYEMCCLTPPFEGPNFSLLVVNILRATYKAIPSHYGPLLEDLVDILLQVKPEDRPSAAQILTIPAMKPYVSAYVNRMRACKETYNYNTPSPALTGNEGVKNTNERKECGSIYEDKENIDPKTSGKTAMQRRVSWATPKQSPLVQCNRVVSSADNASIRKSAAPKMPSKVPKISLYREVLQRKEQQAKIRRKSPGAPATPTSTPKTSHGSSKISKSDRRKIIQEIPLTSPILRIKSSKGKVGKTYTVIQALASPDKPMGSSEIDYLSPWRDEEKENYSGESAVSDSEEQHEENVKAVSEDCSTDDVHHLPKATGEVITPSTVQSPQTSLTDPGIQRYLTVCRLLYNCCQTRSMSQTYAQMENLRAFLEKELGHKAFLKDYTTIREAVALGMQFDEIAEVVTGKLIEFFPLVIQLIQMECCTKL